MFVTKLDRIVLLLAMASLPVLALRMRLHRVPSPLGLTATLAVIFCITFILAHNANGSGRQ